MSDRRRQASVLILVVTLVAMMAAGLVLALDWLVARPHRPNGSPTVWAHPG
ncbi:hypothetical protein HP550_07425 [Cellulomonas humilata]|uniref:Uncharacterized protein n=1 Tax=Cellulomonas humilata TaxID=144055 RepID=A0A7Y6DWW8_9CELL|nr:hypothetical protein [Cellulomonas humilata]